jgi:hypothetical protein
MRPPATSVSGLLATSAASAANLAAINQRAKEARISVFIRMYVCMPV